MFLKSRAPFLGSGNVCSGTLGVFHSISNGNFTRDEVLPADHQPLQSIGQSSFVDF
ncbi:hypothetical protein INR49_000009, partial [Caranx melampygus]